MRSKREQWGPLLRWIGPATALLLQLVCAAQPVWGDESAAVISAPSWFFGRIFSDVWVPTDHPYSNGFEQISTSVWLEGNPKLGEHSQGRFSLDFDALQAGQTTDFRGRLREGYLDYSQNGWEFRVGQQIIPWGKSDAINPTDFLSAKDYTFFNPDEEVKRLGATSLWTSWTPVGGTSPITLNWVWTPVFPQSTLLIPPGLVPAGVTVSATPQSPPTSLKNSETALKLNYAGSNWDASVSGYVGWNHLPEFYLAGFSGTQPRVAETFHRDRSLGADASATSGKWIFRVESAYDWTENDTGTDPLIEPSHWDGVAGVERPFGDDFRAQLQFIWRYFPRFSTPNSIVTPDPDLTYVERQIAQTNALTLGYLQKNRPGATFRFNYTNEKNGVEAEIFAMVNFTAGDYLLRPFFSYRWTDALKTTLGLAYYGGPTDQSLGALHVFNSVFLEGKYVF